MGFDLVGKAVKNLQLSTVELSNAPIKIIPAKKSDVNSRFFSISLCDDRGVVSLENYTEAVLNATLPDGSHQNAMGEVNHDNNTVLCKISSSMLAQNGKVSCDILLSGADENEDAMSLTSQTFYVLVFETQSDDDAIEGSDDYTLLARLLNEVSNLEKSIETAEEERVAEEQTRVAAENKRASAESTRVANESARKSAETSRKAAEEERVEEEQNRIAKFEELTNKVNEAVDFMKQEIVGDVFQSDWNQTDEAKTGFIKNKIPINNGSGKNSISVIEGEANGDYSIAVGIADKSILTELVGSTLASFVETKAPIAAADLSIAIGTNNESNSTGSLTIGVSNIAGVTGYYWHTIDFTNKTITLSTTRPTLLSNSISVPSSIDWQVGDYISIVTKNNKHSVCSKITAIDGNKITVDSLPFNSNDYDGSALGNTTYPVAYTSPDDRTIFAVAIENFDETQADALDSLSTTSKYTIRTGTVKLGFGAYVMGAMSVGTGILSTATGYNNLAAGAFSHAEGMKNISGYSAHSEGAKNKAIGFTSHAEGLFTLAKGNCSHAEGNQTEANNKASHAEGNLAVASGIYSHAEGDGTQSKGHASHAEGVNSEAIGEFSHAEGQDTLASGYTSHVEGAKAQATGDYSHAEGNLTVASGIYSHVEGYNNTASGVGSHAEGNANTAPGQHAHAEGQTNEASGQASHAEGYSNIASAAGAHAEGGNNKALRNKAHAEGSNNTASGDSSHAEGYNNTASASYSHVEGNNNVASGNSSHAEGRNNQAKGAYSHAEGEGAVATASSQHVQGRYNVEDAAAQYAHIVGNGTSDSQRSNAHTVDWNGNGWFAGDILLGADRVSVLNLLQELKDRLTALEGGQW